MVVYLMLLSVLNATCAAATIYQKRFAMAWICAYVSIFCLFAATTEIINFVVQRTVE